MKEGKTMEKTSPNVLQHTHHKYKNEKRTEDGKKSVYDHCKDSTFFFVLFPPKNAIYINCNKVVC